MKSNMKSYNLILIFSAHVCEEDRKGVISKISETIRSNGSLCDIDSWGKKHLAIPIRKESDGFFESVSFETTKCNWLASLTAAIKIMPEVLRSALLCNCSAD